MWLGTFGKNRVLQFVFLTLWILFFLLAFEHWAGNEDLAHTIGHLAGFEGIICGFSAIYLAMAEVINESRGKTVLPIGERD